LLKISNHRKIYALPEEDTLFLNEAELEEIIDRPYYIFENGRKTEVSIIENNKYFCRIASLEEMNQKWDYEIRQHPGTENWIVWKGEAIEGFRSGRSIPYYGILDGIVICEATAVLYSDFPKYSVNADERAVELCAFRTIKEYRGKGYFSKLMSFMLKDLKQKGYIKAVVGVEPEEKINKEIYQHWGFTEHVSTGTETYPDGTVINVAFYGKQL
jgi:GNAT superfamily N-acetyltransferase